MPPNADTTTMTCSFEAADSTIPLRFSILFTEPTDVPPNFITFICTMLFSHICVTVMAFMQPILKSQLKWLWLIPAVNMLYLPLRWFRDLQWSKVLLPLTGLVIFASSIYLMFQSRWSWAFAALLASWVCSITASLIWKSKSEK